VLRANQKRPGGSARDQFEREALTHLDALFAVGVRLTRSHTEGEDLVQDTLVKAMRSRARFAAGTNMRAWLLKILTNTFINRYRRAGLEKSVFDGPDADALADGWVGSASMEAMRDPDGQALRPIVAREIRQALDDLPDEFRLTVLLADVEGLSYREISAIIERPIGTVMSRLHRGRRLLRARLYEHARSSGIVGPEPVLFADEAKPVDLNDYRSRKNGATK